MPEQTDIRTLVSLETDDKGIDDARRQLKEVVKEQQNLTDAFKRGEKDAAEFNREMAALLNKEKGLEKAIDSVTGEFREQAKAMQEAAEEAAKLAQEQEQLSTAQGRFDKVSGGVSLAGDFASASSQVGGGFEGLGFQGAGKVGEIGTFIGDIVEGIPKLQASFAGLPGAINSAGAALGTSGAGFIGILGVAAIAIAAVAFAFKKFTDDAKKQAEELSGVIQTRRDIAQDIGEGRSAQDVEQQIAVDQRVLAEQQKLLQDLEASYNSLNVALRQTEQGKALKEELDAQRTLTQDLSEDISQYSEALEQGKFAQEETTQAIEQQVTAQKELSTAVTETATSANRASQNMRQAARQMSSQSESFNRRRADSARNRSAGTLGFGFLLGGGSKPDGEAAKAQDEAKKQADEFQDKLRDIQQQAQDDRLKQEINHQRALQDVVRNFGDNRVDALAEQNFLALDKLNTEEARAKRDLAIDNKRANEDINRQARQANDRLMQEAQRAQQQRLDMERQALTQSLNNVNSWANALLSITNRLGNARGGGSSSTFNRQPRTP